MDNGIGKEASGKTRICPICGKAYSGKPALSRRDNLTDICPTCGTMEALDATKPLIGPEMGQEEWEDYKRQIIEKMSKIR